MTEPELQEAPTKRISRRRIPPESGSQEPSVPAVPPPSPGTEVSPTILAPAAALPEAPAQPPVTAASAAAPSVPQQDQTISGSPFRKHDVVQVLDTASRHYGQFFMVGDVVRGKVHGYYMQPGMNKEHITVDLQHCWYIGTSKVRSQTPCSPKWISDNRPTKS